MVKERLGYPGRRIRWLVAGSAGVAERTVIAQISAGSRYWVNVNVVLESGSPVKVGLAVA